VRIPIRRLLRDSISLLIESSPSEDSMATVEKLYFLSHQRKLLDPYLPDHHDPFPEDRPWITLTYASSLDSKISAGPGKQTVLSGPASKAMTHYLRTKHDGILVGSGTAITDNPALNSRLSDALDAEDGLELQPQPIILDRRGRWQPQGSKVVNLMLDGRGKGPLVFKTFTQDGPLAHWDMDRFKAHEIPCYPYSDFPQMLRILKNSEGISSIMIEGGATIINSILSDYAHLIDSVIITFAPVYLGDGGVGVSPVGPLPKFEKVAWLPMEDDVVMCAVPKR
jgi:2,5-diamino-6-(ribosylamino)-4(3H)-pyrimidinone 5'-phosphate reductase